MNLHIICSSKVVSTSVLRGPRSSGVMSLPKCTAIDDSLGPHTSGCRGGFDLTQLFEEVTLIIPCVSLLLLVAPFRMFYLLRKGAIKVDFAYLLWCKLVSANLDVAGFQHSTCQPLTIVRQLIPSSSHYLSPISCFGHKLQQSLPEHQCQPLSYP